MKAQARLAVTTLALLLVATGAIAFAWFGVHEKEKAESERASSELRLFPDGLGPIASMTLRGASTIEFVYEDERWKITAPVQARASTDALDGLLRFLSGLSANGVVDAHPTPASLAKYSLDQPRLELRLRPLEGPSRILRIGGRNSFDDTIYLRVDDGPIFLSGKGLHNRLAKDVADFRERRVLPVTLERARRIRVKTATAAYELERRDDEWHLRSPIQERADESTVRGLIAKLAGLRVIEFLDELPEGLSFDEPEGTVRVDLDGSFEELAWSSRMDGEVRRLYAWGTGIDTVAQLQLDAERRVHHTPFELQFKKVLDLDREKVARIEIESGEERFVVVRMQASDAAQWQVVEPERGPAIRWRISSLLYTLQDLRATAFAADELPVEQLGDYGLAEPAATLRVLDADGVALGTLFLGDPTPGRSNRFVTNAARRRVFEVPEPRIQSLPLTLAEIVEPGDSPR